MIECKEITGNPFVLVTIWMRCGIDEISMWQYMCVMEAQISLMLSVSSVWELGYLLHIFDVKEDIKS